MVTEKIAGKTYDEIMSMKYSTRSRWYKTILFEEKEEAMELVETARRIKHSKLMTGKNNPMYGKTGEDNPNFGSTRTEEYKDKMRGDRNPMKRSEVRSKHKEAVNRPEVRAKNSVNNRGKNNPNWKGGPVKYICKNCGNIFFRRRGGKLVYQFCSKSCKSKYYKGILSSNWQGGKSFEPYGLEFNDELKNQIRQRDNYTCQECDITQGEIGQKLDVHHKDYDKTNNKFDNLICLCRPCHMKTNYNRDGWIKYFRRKRR